MPRIDRIQIQNFKSIREMDFQLHNLNVLVGRNGSGKSNFLSFFRFLREAANENLYREITDIGGLNDMKWKGSPENKSVSWSTAFNDFDSVESPTYRVELETIGKTRYKVMYEEFSRPPRPPHQTSFKLVPIRKMLG